MARDRNVYVWQAYVTVMSIVSFACIGALAFVIFSSGTNTKAVEGAVEREQKAQTALREESNRRQLLQFMLGVGKPQTEAEFQQMVSQVANDEELKTATKKYTDNMALMGASATDRNYTNLVDILVQELRSRNMQWTSSQQRELALKDEFDSKLAQETKAREAERQNAQNLSNRLEKELIDYTEKLKAKEDTISKIEADKLNLQKQWAKKNADLAKNYEKAQEEMGKMRKQLESLSTKLNEIKGEDFQYPQGKITQVQSGADGDNVYINLGQKHGLRVGVKFGVIGSDVSRISDAKPKAQIEVVKVINESLSVCKVVSTRAAIILVEDLIYSPAWQPNRKVEFALVGKMDLDGDGSDDRNIVKALIEQNGGIVTVDLPPGEKATAQLSVNTRWMVIGEDFKARVEKDRGEMNSADTQAAKERNALETEAKSLGISRINLDKLMGWLRSAGGDISALGTGMQPNVTDYKKPTSSSSTSGRVSPIFQNRDGSVNRNTKKEPVEEVKIESKTDARGEAK